MIQLKATLIFAAILFSASAAEALTPDQLTYVKNAVIELCRGGTLTGKGHNYLIDINGNITTVLIPKVIEGAAHAARRRPFTAE